MAEFHQRLRWRSAGIGPVDDTVNCGLWVGRHDGTPDSPTGAKLGVYAGFGKRLEVRATLVHQFLDACPPAWQAQQSHGTGCRDLLGEPARREARWKRAQPLLPAFDTRHECRA